MSLELNTLAPDFELMGSDNNKHSLKDYRGKKVILYFYPKDNTPGCTSQACDFRDNYSELKDLNAVVLGVSKDSLDSHDKFITKIGIPFILLSDPDETVCKLYDVIKEKSMFGKKYMGIERSTFIIDENGILIKEYRKVKVKDHVNKIIKDIK